MTTETAKQRVLKWRAEIAGELAEAKKAIAPLVTAHDAAAEQLRVIAEEYRETQLFLGSVITRPETALKLRYDAHLAELNQARGRKARAAADLEAARARVKDLQRALDQIDAVIPVEETEESTT